MIAERNAAWPWRVALGLVALALVWRVIHVNAVLYEDTGFPRLPSPTSAGDRGALRGVIRENPGEVAALLMVARDLEGEGKAAEAERAYLAALELAPLDRDVLALAASFFLRRDDARGIEILGRLATHVPAAREGAFAALREAMAARRQQPAVASLFSADPAWLGAFIADACARGVDPALYVPMLLRKAGTAAALPQAGCAIDRLRAAGRWDEAYQLWLNTLPPERLKQVGFVFNGGFEHAVSGAGFDWTLQPRPERETGHVAEAAFAQGGSGKRALRVAYNGRRQSGVPAIQYLVLPPGAYELSGLARPQGIVAPRGIQWSIRCANAKQARLASSERFLGSSEWRRFTMEAHIDASCPAQTLQLEPAVDEGAAAFVSGVAWFDDLAIRRR